MNTPKETFGKHKATSRVTRGKTLHAGKVDSRRAPARRFSDLVSAFLAEAGAKPPRRSPHGRCAARCGRDGTVGGP